MRRTIGWSENDVGEKGRGTELKKDSCDSMAGKGINCREIV